MYLIGNPAFLQIKDISGCHLPFIYIFYNIESIVTVGRG